MQEVSISIIQLSDCCCGVRERETSTNNECNIMKHWRKNRHERHAIWLIFLMSYNDCLHVVVAHVAASSQQYHIETFCLTMLLNIQSLHILRQ